MKLKQILLGAVAALVLGQMSASACIIPICLPNPSNCGGKPPVSSIGAPIPVLIKDIITDVEDILQDLLHL